METVPVLVVWIEDQTSISLREDLSQSKALIIFSSMKPEVTDQVFCSVSVPIPF